MFTVITKWFWAIALLSLFINVCIFQLRANQQIKEHPELADGYKLLIRGFAIWSSIPWVVMGIGCTIGSVPTVFHFFRPRDGNPYVLSFYLSVFIIWILGSYWLFFRNGAQMLVNHPGVFNYNFKNPRMVKLLWIAGLVGGVLGVFMMFTQDIPIPK